MASLEVPELAYEEYTNRQLAAVPLAILAVAVAVLGITFALTGAPLGLGIEFTGGAELTIATTADQDEVAAAFEQEPTSIQPVEGSDQYIVQFAASDLEGFDEDGQAILQDLVDQADENLAPSAGADGSSPVVGESLTSASFGQQIQFTALIGLVVAFIGMSAITFGLFRTFVPSVAVSLSAFSDLIIPLAFMSLFDIQLTLGTVAALLMLIGYSVDSDILLNNHVLRRSGSFYESVHRSMRTGITMTVTSTVAMLVMAAVSWFFGIGLLRDIGLILAVGLIADLMNTYLMNVSLLRWYKFEGVSR
ncbi:preprotein translocase subunit SecF [Halovivax ruber XH-70]|uniref:Protein-export membrane protein SecF n=1 Tax=Halovivax ruber (strain DSM 18193 / JCM 13892 / XH-70) TaxID=797302 RepID=L0I7I9_HALRX|nr:protein translocase subunit SecF [Halovivax ruber]AGB14748.1 preprotein translocase subunit SecF [Halovivax ruber XH-70]